MGETSAGKGKVVRQGPDRYSEEVSDGGEQLCFWFGISVFPVGNGAAHQAEFLIAAGLGHAFHFPQNSEFGSE